jgi:hypothetical protein
MQRSPDDSIASSRKGIKSGAPRGGGYDAHECTIVTRAMISAKNDPVRGSGQKVEDFHARFRRRFDELTRPGHPIRSTLSLVDKFKEIRRDSGQFGGMLFKIRNLPKKSGTTSSEESEIAQVCCLNATTTLHAFHFHVVFRLCELFKLLTVANSNS